MVAILETAPNTGLEAELSALHHRDFLPLSRTAASITPQSIPRHESLFQDIREPGAYLLLGHDLLLRVPAQALLAGQCPILGLTGPEPLDVVKLSDDPWIPISLARRLAATLGREVGF